MITNLRIENFKSVKNLDIDCRKLNVFVGEPNVGKSNILETLGLCSWVSYHDAGSLNDFIRFGSISNLFLDDATENPVGVHLTSAAGACGVELFSDKSFFSGRARQNGKEYARFRFDNEKLISFERSPQTPDSTSRVKFYRFGTCDEFSSPVTDFLMPPCGNNFAALLKAREDLREAVEEIFRPYRMRLILNPAERRLEVSRQVRGKSTVYPFALIADTLQRMAFYLAAVLSNENSTIVFEEPESHAFPYYTKQLAEMIALDDKKNQFFITTHNQYFLQPLVEKASLKDLAVFIVHCVNDETRVKALSAPEIEEIMEIDLFSNLERYLTK